MGQNEDGSEDEGRFHSRTSVLGKQKKRKKKDKKFLKGSEIEYSSEQSLRLSDSNLEEEVYNLSRVKTNGNKKRGLQKVGHVKSAEIEDISDTENKPIPLDVVVDVHCESENKRNVPRKRRNGKSEKIAKNRKPRESEEDLTIVESLDAIEELAGPGEKAEKIFDAPAKPRRKSLENTSSPSTGEEGRKTGEWILKMADQLEETKKPARKRWSKDTSVIELPGNQRVASSARSPLARNSGKPVAAPRASKKPSESVFAFDNAAFEADQEDVLRIETDYQRKSMKIEMRAMDQRYKEESSSFVASNGESNNETVVMIEQTEDSESDVHSGVEGNGLSFERSASSKRRSSKSSQGARKSRESRGSTSLKKENRPRSRRRGSRNRSLESVVETEDSSDSSLSLENVPTKDFAESSDGDFIRRLRKASRSRTKSKRYSSQETASTNEGNDSFDDRTKVIKDGSVESSARKQKKKKSAGKEQRKVETERGRKKMSSKEGTSSSAQDANSAREAKTKKKKRKKEKNKDVTKFISITIHRSDLLETDYVTKHPMVKVHIVNTETGEYLKDENQVGATYLQPKITRKFDFRENRSMMPVWEEELIFHRDFQVITNTGNAQVVVLFEVVDLLTFAEASFNYDKFGNDACWYKIAWAFLKPVGTNNTMHTDKKVRLQLYRPRRNMKKISNKCEVYNWWKSNSREKYPSSLFVTVTSVDPPKEEPIIYQQLPSNELNELRYEPEKCPTPTSDMISLPKWTRIAAQSCKIPNEKLFETESSENGSFFIVFSNDGKFLACVVSDEYDYPIVIYEVESGKIHVRFSGHKTFVYSLNWSKDDRQLLSVSSDQTARLWDVENKIIQHVYMLPHPSYVYCGKFDPTNPLIVATGCYDRVARIWAKNGKSETHELSQELEGHEGFVNSMCFQADSNLITADSVGVIIIWKAKKSRRAIMRKEWQAFRTIKAKEIEGVTINTILLHPLGSRLLVHSRDNGLRMLDLATGVVLQRYDGLKNQRIQTSACISPCGGLVLCGDEDSSLNVWHLETGKHLARYTTERNLRAVTCVDYHPYDHVLAYSTFGSPAPVRVLRFNKDADGQEVGLKLTEVNGMHIGDIAVSFLNLSSTLKERRKSNNKLRIPLEVPKEESTMSRKTFARESVVENVPRREEADEDARTRLRRLNERQETLKGKSANRLFRIIEKIDRILSNSSRSPDDLESGLSAVVQNTDYLNRSSENVYEGQHEIIMEEERPSGSRSLKNLLIDQSSPCIDSSGTRSSKTTDFELQELSVPREKSENGLVLQKRRSKSANIARLVRSEERDTKTFSDSGATSRGGRWLQKGSGDIPMKGQAESSFILDPKNLEKSKSVEKASTSDSTSSSRSRRSKGSSHIVSKNETENNFTKESQGVRSRKFDSSSDPTSSLDSVGTYVVEKADFEKNNDTNSVKIHGTKSREKKEDYLNPVKSGSDVSIQSNATFVVENEVPVPKPRKKKTIH